jgi:hypothetical protein
MCSLCWCGRVVRVASFTSREACRRLSRLPGGRQSMGLAGWPASRWVCPLGSLPALSIPPPTSPNSCWRRCSGHIPKQLNMPLPDAGGRLCVCRQAAVPACMPSPAAPGAQWMLLTLRDNPLRLPGGTCTSHTAYDATAAAAAATVSPASMTASSDMRTLDLRQVCILHHQCQ